MLIKTNDLKVWIQYKLLFMREFPHGHYPACYSSVGSQRSRHYERKMGRLTCEKEFTMRWRTKTKQVCFRNLGIRSKDRFYWALGFLIILQRKNRCYRDLHTDFVWHQSFHSVCYISILPLTTRWLYLKLTSAQFKRRYVCCFIYLFIYFFKIVRIRISCSENG